MFKLTRTQPLPIGIDIGADSIKMMQLQVVGDDLEVACAAREAMPPAPASDINARSAVALDTVRQTLRRHEFRGRRAIVSLPRELMHVKTLRLPPMPADEVAAVLQYEARNLFPFDTDQATIHHLCAGEVRQGADIKQELIVLAAKNAEIDQYVEQLHASDLVVDGLDYEPVATYRSIERFMRRKEDDQDVNVLVDIGLRRSQVIIGRGHELSLVKPIEIGGQHLRDLVARKLELPADEAISLRRRLAEAMTIDPDAARGDSVRQAVYDATRGMMEDLGREISLCLRYYSVTFRGARPTRVRLVGGEAADPQLLQILNGALSIPVETGRALQNVDFSKMRPTLRKGPMSEWSVAMGLSLKGTDRYFAGKDGRPRGVPAPTAAEAPIAAGPPNAGRQSIAA